MEEILEYRVRMVKQFGNAADKIEAALQRNPDPSQPLESGGWNLHQVITHMRDVNKQVYLPRLKRIIAEENPMFENFDGDAWMAAHYQAEEPLQEIVSEFKEQCRSTTDWLTAHPIEAWNRPGTHPTLGKHSLQWWVERTLAHINEHLTQLKVNDDPIT